MSILDSRLVRILVGGDPRENERKLRSELNRALQKYAEVKSR